MKIQNDTYMINTEVVQRLLCSNEMVLVTDKEKYKFSPADMQIICQTMEDLSRKLKVPIAVEGFQITTYKVKEK